jgi:hypothetical protein
MRRLTVHGLLIPDLIPQYAQQFFTEVPALLSQGKIKASHLVVRVWRMLIKPWLNCSKEIILARWWWQWQMNR